MARVKLGFDIGTSSMKITALQGETTTVWEVRLPENLTDENGVAMPNAFSRFLKDTCRQLGIPKGEGALVLPPTQVICRFVSMPSMTTDQLMMNLPYEFSDFIQGLPDQYFCDYAVCQRQEEGEGEETIPMMAAVAAKSQLEEYIRMFARGGVKLRTLLPPEMALIQLAEAYRLRSDGPEESCFVDLGQQDTRITILWRDRVQATRQIPLGGRSLDAAIAEELGVDAFLANSYKVSDHQNVLSLPAVRDICERIAVELLKVVNFYHFTYRSNTLPGIYLIGGGAELGPLRQAIAGTIGMPLLDPAELFPGIPGEGTAVGALAAGAVMGREQR